MPSVQYGKTTIKFAVKVKKDLRTHYISVESDKGVILQGPRVPVATANKLILKKAQWIIDKLQRVKVVKAEPITTGSRVPYLGKQYYVEVKFSKRVSTAIATFNHSMFKIVVNPEVKPQAAIRTALEYFYKEKAVEKISPRVEKLSKQTGLTYNKLKYVRMGKRWGSCTADNNIIINTQAIKLPFSLIDYLIVHELSHTKVKDHSKEFYAEVAKHMSDWRKLDERISNGEAF
jgi:predicted metal-dependent hydrolase